MAVVRAPELVGAGGWIGVDDLSLAALRGRLVLLDFWTSACINCVHVVEELRELERRYAAALTVVGVHSPKFAHERAHDVVHAAVAARRIEHPVLNDPELVTWDAYAVRAWPTLVLVGPDGYEVARWSGEGHAEEIAATIERVLAGAPVTAPPPAGAAVLDGGELAFPGKVDASPDGRRLAVSDTGHDRVVVCGVDGAVDRVLDGLHQPQGVRFEPGGDALLVCEQGAGRVWRVAFGGDRVLVAEGLSSPWDVVRWHGHVTIAEAGRHRVRMVDAAGEAQVVAGTGAENLVDGPALGALLAQPSGLAVTARGELAFVDAESSALRVLDAPGGTVRTLVGTGLFAWGDADGGPEVARMQHPLGVATGPAGVLYVADTFNGLVRVHRGAHLWTLPVEGFRDPGGVTVLPDGRLVVADTGHHRLVVVDAEGGAAEALAVRTAETWVGSPLRVELDLDLDGEDLDHAGGSPVLVTLRADPAELLAGTASFALDALPARLDVPLAAGAGTVTADLRAATCGEGVCRLRRTSRTWHVIVDG